MRRHKIIETEDLLVLIFFYIRPQLLWQKFYAVGPGQRYAPEEITDTDLEADARGISVFHDHGFGQIAVIELNDQLALEGTFQISADDPGEQRFITDDTVEFPVFLMLFGRPNKE